MTWTEWMGIASTFGMAVMGYLKFKQSQKVDAATEKSGVVSSHQAGMEQVVQGYDRLLARAQLTIDDDQDIKKLLEDRNDRYLAGWQACMKENARLRRKYGNGDDNGDTPQPPTKEPPSPPSPTPAESPATAPA